MSEENSGTATSNTPQAVETTQPSTESVADYTEFDLDSIINEYLGEGVEKVERHSINTQEVLKELPEDALKLIQNLRKDYTKKTQQLSTQKRELEQREQTWLSRQEHILRSKLDLPPDFDITAEGGIQKYLEVKVAEMLLEAQRPLVEQVEINNRREELQNFRRQNPDITEYREAMIGEMGKDPTLTLERAYYLAKGKSADRKINEVRLELEKQKEAKLHAVSKVGVGGTSRAEGTPRFTNALDAYRYLQSKQK